MHTIGVFCGSGSGNSAAIQSDARKTGEVIAAMGCDLVYGGSKLGLMGIVADAVMAGGKRVTGVIPRLFKQETVGHDSLSEMILTDSMDERKRIMIEKASAFVVLPGGYGTFDEMFEVLTLTQIMQSDKPIVLLNSEKYYDKLLEFLNHAVQTGFVYGDHFKALSVAESPEEIPELLRAWQKPTADTKFLERIG